MPFAEKLSPVISQAVEAVTKEHSFDNGILLQASFDDLYTADGETKQIQFKYSEINKKGKHLIKASIYELAAKAMEVVSESGRLELFGKENNPRIFNSGNAEAAREKLARLTDLYLEGLRKPLEFFPKYFIGLYQERK